MTVQVNFSTQGISLDAMGVLFETGWYKFVITNSKLQPTTGDANSQMVVFDMKCIEGKMLDSIYTHRLNLFHATSEVAVRIAKQDLARLCYVCGKPGGVGQTAELYNIPFAAHITTTKQPGRKNADGSEGKPIDSMSITDLRDLAGRTPKDIAAAMQGGAGGPQGGPPMGPGPSMAHPQAGPGPGPQGQPQAYGAPMPTGPAQSAGGPAPAPNGYGAPAPAGYPSNAPSPSSPPMGQPQAPGQWQPSAPQAPTGYPPQAPAAAPQAGQWQIEGAPQAPQAPQQPQAPAQQYPGYPPQQPQAPQAPQAPGPGQQWGAQPPQGGYTAPPAGGPPAGGPGQWGGPPR